MNDNTQKIKELISAYLDGELNQEETSRVEDLILNNKEWQRYYKELQGLQNVLTAWEDEAISPDLTSKVQKSLLEQKLKEDKKMNKPSLKRQMAPVITLAAFVIVGLLAMQVYVKRGTQGRLKQAADDVGDQFSAGNQKTSIITRGEYKPYAKTNDTFARGVTQSAVVAPEATMLAGESRIVDAVEEEFWGGGKGDLAQLSHDAPAKQKARNMSQGAAGYLDANLPASAPAEMKLSKANYEPYYLETDYKVGRKKEARDRALYDVDEGSVVFEEAYSPYRQDKQFNTENYNRIYENEFLTVDENPLSTFSIDVDTASYANLRRFLNNGQVPPKDAVRIEELVNYFSYNYPEPKRGEPFSVTLKASTAPWNKDHQLMMIGLQGMTLQQNEIPPSNLVFLIDVSGSMKSANKLPLLKESFKMMVNQLGPNERVAIVVYAGAAGEVLPSTSGADKQRILSAIDRLSAGGSTAGGAGIELAYKIAKQNFIKGGNNRVILATDGDFNIGVSNDADLTRIIEEKRKDGIFLTTLGFGMGNYKDSRLEQIANKGNGNHYYIDGNAEARKVLVHELGSTLFTIAKDVKLQIEFNPAQVKAYRLIGYENRMLAKEDFNDDTKDAGELGAGHTVTALYEIVPADSREVFGTVDKLKYQVQKAVRSSDLLTVKLRYKKPDEHKSRLLQESIKMNEIMVEPRGDFEWAASVAEFGLILRDSKFKGSANFQCVLNHARNSIGHDPFGYRAEFIGLVEQVRSLVPEYGIHFKEADPQPAAEGGMFFKGSQNQ